MLVAVLKDSSRAYAWLAEKKQKPFYCPACAGEVILKKGKIREHHFAHKPPSDCLFGTGESQVHLKAKRQIYNALIFHPLCTFCELEQPLDGARPDIIFTTKGNQIALEVQKSNISTDDMARRMLQYTRLGIHVLWIVPFPLPPQGERYRPRKWEKFLHAMYYGRLYYWLYSAFVMPVHFNEHRYWVDQAFNVHIDEYVGGYYKYSRAYREPVHFERQLHIIDDFKTKNRESFRNVPACNLWIDSFFIPQ